MRSTSAFAVSCAAAILAAASAAGATLAQQPSPSTVAPEAADQTYGMAIMSASVNPDGTHVSGNAAGVVEAAYDDATKQYIVKFNRPLAGCVNTASAWSSGVIVSTRVYSYSGTLAVKLVNLDGDQVEDAFQIIVFCAR